MVDSKKSVRKKLSTNMERGNYAEKLVIDHFKRIRIKARKESSKKGYDIKAGNLLIEVKGTSTIPKNNKNAGRSTVALSQNQFAAACKSKHYWIYWVNTRTGRIIQKIKRDDVLKNAKPRTDFIINLKPRK